MRTLAIPTKEYVRAKEGEGWFDPAEVAALADTYVNEHPNLAHQGRSNVNHSVGKFAPKSDHTVEPKGRARSASPRNGNAYVKSYGTPMHGEQSANDNRFKGRKPNFAYNKSD